LGGKEPNVPKWGQEEIKTMSIEMKKKIPNFSSKFANQCTLLLGGAG